LHQHPLNAYKFPNVHRLFFDNFLEKKKGKKRKPFIDEMSDQNKINSGMKCSGFMFILFHEWSYFRFPFYLFF
jgi:hypothetical protein